MNAPWVFGLVMMSYGFNGTVVGLLVGFLLRKHGIAVDQIAGVVALALLPQGWSFLLSPLADSGLARRHVLLWCALGAAGMSFLAILGIGLSSLGWLTAWLFLAMCFMALHSAATGGLLTAAPAWQRGQVSGWMNAGNIGAGAVGGGIFIGLADHIPGPALAVAVGCAIALPSVAGFFLLVEEVPVRRSMGPLVRDLLRDLREIFRDRRTWFGLFLFISPAGSFAVTNLISGLGPDYHAPAGEVLWVTGVGAGLLTTAGCFVGIFLADRMNRMVAYALGGLLAAFFGAYLALGPATPWTYGAAYLGYALANGFSFCVFTALLLDVVGPRKHAASTAYAVLNSSGNLAISYMVWLDGLGYARWGARGAAGTDAVLNGISAVSLVAVAVWVMRSGNRGKVQTRLSPG